MDNILIYSLILNIILIGIVFIIVKRRKSNNKMSNYINNELEIDRRQNWNESDKEIQELKEDILINKQNYDGEMGIREINVEQALELFDESIELSESSFTQNETKKNVTIVFFEHDCWRCKKNSHVWWLFDNKSPIHIRDSFNWLFCDSIINKVWNYQKSLQGDILFIGEIRNRESKQMETSYKSFGCYHCGFILGMNFISRDAEKTNLSEVSPNMKIETQLSFPIIFNEKDPEGILSEKQMYHIYKSENNIIKDKILKGDYKSGKIILGKYLNKKNS